MKAYTFEIPHHNQLEPKPPQRYRVKKLICEEANKLQKNQ